MASKKSTILIILMLLNVLPLAYSKSMYTQGLRITMNDFNAVRNEQCYQLEFLIVISLTGFDSVRQLTSYTSQTLQTTLSNKLTQSMNSQLEVMEASRLVLEKYLSAKNGDFQKNGGQFAKMIGSGPVTINIKEVKEIGEYSNVIASICFTPKPV